MKYQDTNNNSGITAFCAGADWIQIEFKGASTYEYHAEKIGQDSIDEMKNLAHDGNGLNRFINRNPAIRKSACKVHRKIDHGANEFPRIAIRVASGIDTVITVEGEL